MSKLYIRVKTGFYTHRKTARLRAAIGDDAYWIPPRLWAYCAENQPDGDISSYQSSELAELLGCPKYATSILQALIDAGFVDSEKRVHDWSEHNGYHETYSKRAKTAAEARWAKEREKETEKEIGEKHCGKDATSIYQQMAVRLNSMFNRTPETPWDYAEEQPLTQISKRPAALSELGEIESLKAKNPKYPEFPHSISRLLNDWNSTLDRARNYVPPNNAANGQKPNPRNFGTAEEITAQTNAGLAKIARQAEERRKRYENSTEPA